MPQPKYYKERDPFAAFNKYSEFEKTLLAKGVKTIAAVGTGGYYYLFGPMVAVSMVFDLEKLLSTPFPIGYPSFGHVAKYKLAKLEEISKLARASALSYSIEEIGIEEMNVHRNLGKSRDIVVQAAYNQVCWQIRTDYHIDKPDLTLLSYRSNRFVSESDRSMVKGGFNFSLCLNLAYLVALTHYRMKVQSLIWELSANNWQVDDMYEISKTNGNACGYVSKNLVKVFREKGPTKYHRKYQLKSVLNRPTNRLVAAEGATPFVIDPGEPCEYSPIQGAVTSVSTLSDVVVSSL